MTILDITATVKGKYLLSKSILAIIQKDKFQHLYSLATEEKKQYVLDAINKNDKIGLLRWIHIESGDISITKLRHLAKSYAVKNYLRLSAYTLYNHMIKILGEKELLEQLNI